jgi:hypothetical protein
MRSTLSAKLHEYSARVSYIEANLPRGPTSPQQSHPALNQQQQQQIGGGGGGLTFPPIPGEDPFTVLSGGSPSAGRPAAPSSSSSSASFGSPHQPHHQQQQQQYQQPQQQQQYQPQQYQPQYQQQPQFQQTPAPGSGGFSAAPYGAPPSTKLPAHQLIKMPAQVYIGEYVVISTTHTAHAQHTHDTTRHTQHISRACKHRWTVQKGGAAESAGL